MPAGLRHTRRSWEVAAAGAQCLNGHRLGPGKVLVGNQWSSCDSYGRATPIHAGTLLIILVEQRSMEPVGTTPLSAWSGNAPTFASVSTPTN